LEKTELASKYTGDVAFTYDARKTSKEKWSHEQDALESLLAETPRQAAILDVPVGTGRFFDYYKERELTVTGVDMSSDMLALAHEKSEIMQLGAILTEGNILNLPHLTGTFDCVICIRLMNWLETGDYEQALRELARVTNKHVIVGVRVSDGDDSYGATVLRAIHHLSVVSGLRKDERITVHPAATFERAFRAAGLSEIKATEILPRRAGTIYKFILARKTW